MPRLSEPVTRMALAAGEAVDRAGFERLAFGAAAVVHAMEYYRGVRAEVGLAGAVRQLARYLRDRRRS